MAIEMIMGVPGEGMSLLDTIKPPTLPPMIKRIIQKSHIRRGAGYSRQSRLFLLAASLREAGYECQLYERLARLSAHRAGYAAATSSTLVGLEINGTLFNLKGSAGWEQIAKDHLQDYQNAFDVCEWKGEAKEVSPDDLPFSIEKVTQIAREQMILEQQKILNRATKNMAKTKVKTSRKM